MERKRVVVLGGGMVGGFIARQLAADEKLDVTVADRDAGVLERLQERARLSTEQADLSDVDIVRSVISEAELVVGAVPGWMGYAMLQTVIAAGINCVDISFFPEDSLALDEQARQRGATVIVDCGVMPGLGGMLGARMAEQLRESGEKPTHLTIMVGGLPVERKLPLEYKAPFSPMDVLEEYTRPARLREHGREVIYPALSGVEHVNFPGVGTLEAFNTDGLRTLLTTLDIPNMREKTLRYPGQAEKMQLLSDLGLLSSESLRVRGADIVPVEVTAAALEQIWRLEPGEREFTAMLVEVSGEATALRAELLDYTAPDTGDSSMARTTGWPAILAAQLVLQGHYIKPGVTVPEQLALHDDAWEYIDRGLAKAGITVKRVKTL